MTEYTSQEDSLRELLQRSSFIVGNFHSLSPRKAAAHKTRLKIAQKYLEGDIRTPKDTLAHTRAVRKILLRMLEGLARWWLAEAKARIRPGQEEASSTGGIPASRKTASAESQLEDIGIAAREGFRRNLSAELRCEKLQTAFTDAKRLADQQWRRRLCPELFRYLELGKNIYSWGAFLYFLVHFPSWCGTSYSACIQRLQRWTGMPSSSKSRQTPGLLSITLSTGTFILGDPFWGSAQQDNPMRFDNTWSGKSKTALPFHPKNERKSAQQKPSLMRRPAGEDKDDARRGWEPYPMDYLQYLKRSVLLPAWGSHCIAPCQP